MAQAQETKEFAVNSLTRIGILLLIFTLLGWSYMQFHQPPRSAPEVEFALPRLVVADVVGMDIRHAGNILHFVRKQGGWQLVGYESRQVDEQAMKTLLDDLATMRTVRTVATGTAHDRNLGLDKGQRIHVRLSDASTVVLEADIGKQGTDLATTFLRLQGTDTVVAVDKMLRWQLQRTSEGWLKTKDAALPGKEGASSGS